MSFEQITFVLESTEASQIYSKTTSSDGETTTQKISVREVLRLDFFADELQKCTQVEIQFVEVDVSPIPDIGIIILCLSGSDILEKLQRYPEISSVARRAVLLSPFIDDDKLINWACLYGFAGFINSTTYTRWIHNIHAPQVYGLIQAANAGVPSIVSKYRDYYPIGSITAEFPSIFVEYLEAYHELFLTPSAELTFPDMDPRWPTIWEIVYEREDNRELNGIDLSKCNLGGGYFKHANLRNADLSQSNLGRAHFDQANLQNVNLSSSNLDNALFRKADLRGANLVKANLCGAFLQGADLRGADLEAAWLGEAKFQNTNIDDSTNIDERWRLVWRIVNRTQTDKDLHGVNLSYSILADTDLKHYNLCGAIFDKANLVRANLCGSNLQHALLNDTYLSQANMSKVNLSKAKLQYANLDGADLTGANFTETSLSNVNLRGANLKGANFTRTYLGDVSLHGANFTQSKLSGAMFNRVKYDLHTKWPRGFDPDKIGAILESDE